MLESEIKSLRESVDNNTKQLAANAELMARVESNQLKMLGAAATKMESLKPAGEETKAPTTRGRPRKDDPARDGSSAGEQKKTESVPDGKKEATDDDVKAAYSKYLGGDMTKDERAAREENLRAIHNEVGAAKRADIPGDRRADVVKWVGMLLKGEKLPFMQDEGGNEFA